MSEIKPAERRVEQDVLEAVAVSEEGLDGALDHTNKNVDFLLDQEGALEVNCRVRIALVLHL